MIVFDLECRTGGHRFEGWFGSSEDFAAQSARGLVQCPACGSGEVGRAPSAPAVGRKGNQRSEPAKRPAAPAALATIPEAQRAEIREFIGKLAVMQGEALKNSRWVGSDFAEVSRAIHYGERANEVVHGQATADEARELAAEGVPVTPLPFPVAPPDDIN